MLRVYSRAGRQMLELTKLWTRPRASIPGFFWLLVCSVKSSRPNTACTPFPLHPSGAHAVWTAPFRDAALGRDGIRDAVPKEDASAHR
jgi:hypothetical protein